MLVYGHNDSAPNFFARVNLLNGECRAVLPFTWANMDGALPGQTVQSWQNRCTNTTPGGFLSPKHKCDKLRRCLIHVVRCRLSLTLATVEADMHIG